MDFIEVQTDTGNVISLHFLFFVTSIYSTISFMNCMSLMNVYFCFFVYIDWYTNSIIYFYEGMLDALV